MTKDIGILTFQNTMNYGAVLQTYALQHYLQSVFKNKINVINYYNEEVTKREMPVTFSSLKSIKQIVKYLLNHRTDQNKLEAVKAFCKDYIEYSPLSYFESDRPKFDEYEAIIAGSDQIWNIYLTGNDTTYMLDRFEGKGYSYAASIGREGILTPQAINAIRKLKMVSVRESTAQIELEKHGIDSTLVCDPTFLLKKEEWCGLIPGRIIEKKYVLLYQMTSSSNIFRFAKEIAKKKGAILINANPISLQLFRSRCVRDASPLSWLSLLYNAECVVTNSFHGLAFSINFEKEFYTELLDNEAKNTSRISSLLDILNLRDRNILSSNFSECPIDYNNVSSKLDEFRRQSYDYINRMINNFMYE